MRRSAVVGVLLAMLVAAAPAAAAPGVLDDSFGNGGVFLGTTFATQYDDQQVVAVDAQGRALVAITEDSGQMQHYTDSRLWVARLTPAGALDPTFAPGAATPGLEKIDFGAAIDPADWVSAAGIRPGPGGSIVVLAAIDGSSGPRVGLMRLDGAGGYDASLNGTGRLVTNLSTVGYNPTPMALLVDDAGRMLVSGAESFINHNNNGFVARFTAAGALDTTFAGTGLFADPGSTAAGQPSVQYRDLAFAPAGGIVAAGDRDLDAAALKLTAAGAPDPGFGGGDGIATSDFVKGPGFSIASGFGIGIDSQGRVLLSGQTTPASADAKGTVARFTPAGALDPTWGSGTPAPGIVWLTLAQMARASGLLVSSGDRVVISGSGSADPDGPGPYGQSNAPSIARLTAAGTLDPSFGSGGVTVTSVGVYANGYRLVADPTHQRLLVPGSRTLQAPPYDVRPFVLAYGDDGSTGAPPPPPSGGTPAPPASTPAAPVAPAGAVVPPPAAKPTPPPPATRLTIAQAVAFPPTKSCASRRKFGIRLRVPKSVAVKDATVSLNGKRVAVRKGSRLRSTVNLLHLPKGTFTVSIQIRLADGTVLKGSRKYHTCVAKRHGGKPKV
jgi:uncharacterized delta-60 repeat protein